MRSNFDNQRSALPKPLSTPATTNPLGSKSAPGSTPKAILSPAPHSDLVPRSLASSKKREDATDRKEVYAGVSRYEHVSKTRRESGLGQTSAENLRQMMKWVTFEDPIGDRTVLAKQWWGLTATMGDVNLAYPVAKHKRFVPKGAFADNGTIKPISQWAELDIRVCLAKTEVGRDGLRHLLGLHAGARRLLRSIKSAADMATVAICWRGLNALIENGVVEAQTPAAGAIDDLLVATARQARSSATPKLPLQHAAESLRGFASALRAGVIRQDHREYRDACVALLGFIAAISGPSDKWTLSNAWYYLSQLFEVDPNLKVESHTHAVVQKLSECTQAEGSKGRWTPMDLTQILRGLQAVVDARVFARQVPEFPEWFRGVCRLMLEAVAASSGHAWEPRQIASAWSYIGALLGTRGLFNAQDAQAKLRAVRALLAHEASARAAAIRWEPIDLNQILRGLSRAIEFDVVVPTSESSDEGSVAFGELQAAARRMFEALATPKTQGWEERDISNCWAYVGRLLTTQPQLFDSPSETHRLAAVRRLLALTPDNIAAWSAMAIVQVLQGLSAVIKAGVVVPGTQSDKQQGLPDCFAHLQQRCRSMLQLLQAAAPLSPPRWIGEALSRVASSVGDLLAADPAVFDESERQAAVACLLHFADALRDEVERSGTGWDPASLRAAQALANVVKSSSAKQPLIANELREVESTPDLLAPRNEAQPEAVNEAPPQAVLEVSANDVKRGPRKQFERLAASISRGRLQFDAGDGPEIVAMLGELADRLDGDGGVELASAALRRLTLSIGASAATLRFAATNAAEARDAIARLKTPSDMRSAELAAELADLEDAISRCADTPGRRTRSDPVDQETRRQADALRGLVAMALYPRSLLKTFANLNLARPNPLQVATGSDCAAFLEIICKGEDATALKAVEVLVAAIEAREQDPAFTEVPALLAELIRVWNVRTSDEWRVPLRRAVASACRRMLKLDMREMTGSLDVVCDLLTGSAILTAADNTARQLVSSIAAALASKATSQQLPSHKTFTFSRLGELLHGLAQANAAELLTPLTQCFSAIEPDDDRRARLHGLGEFAVLAWRCKTLPEADVAALIKTFAKGLDAPTWARPYGRFNNAVYELLMAPQEGHVKASVQLKAIVLARAGHSSDDLLSARLRIAQAWSVSDPVPALEVILRQLGELRARRHVIDAEAWQDAISEVMEFGPKTIKQALAVLWSVERAALKRNLEARNIPPAQDTDGLIGLIGMPGEAVGQADLASTPGLEMPPAHSLDRDLATCLAWLQEGKSEAVLTTHAAGDYDPRNWSVFEGCLLYGGTPNILVVGREARRMVAEGEADPNFVLAYTGSWRGQPYHEAQQGTECGVHTLNNFNLRMPDGDMGLLITKDTLDTFIWDELHKAHPNLPMKQASAEFRRETALHATEYLVAFNNAHVGEGFPRLERAIGENTENGEFVVHAPSGDPDRESPRNVGAELDAAPLVGLTFQFQSEENPEALMPHTVVIERAGRRYLMWDSRKQLALELRAPSMSGAISLALNRFGLSREKNEERIAAHIQGPAQSIRSLLELAPGPLESPLLNVYVRQALPNVTPETSEVVAGQLASLRGLADLDERIRDVLKQYFHYGSLGAADIFYPATQGELSAVRGEPHRQDDASALVSQMRRVRLKEVGATRRRELGTLAAEAIARAASEPAAGLIALAHELHLCAELSDPHPRSEEALARLTVRLRDSLTPEMLASLSVRSAEKLLQAMATALFTRGRFAAEKVIVRMAQALASERWREKLGALNDTQRRQLSLIVMDATPLEPKNRRATDRALMLLRPPPQVNDLEGARNALDWYIGNGRLGQLADLVSDLEPGGFDVGKLAELIEMTSTKNQLSTSPEVLAFVKALADRTASLVSSEAIGPLNPNRTYDLLVAIVACMGDADHGPQDPSLAAFSGLVETVVFRCVNNVSEPWKAWWKKQSLATVKGRCDVVYSLRKAAWIRDSAVQVPDEADPRVVQMFARGLASSSGSGLSDLHAGLVRWSSTNAPTEAAARNLLLLVSALDPLITSTVDWALNEAPRWVAVFIDMLNAKWGLLDAANVESPSTKQLVAAVAHILNPKDTAAQWLAEFASESFREEISLDLLVQWREKGEGKRLTFNLEGLSAETARRMARAYYRGPITTWVRHHLEGPPEVTAAFRSMKPRT